MGRLSSYAKQRILHLHTTKHKISHIVRILEEEDIPTTRLTVSKFLRRAKETDTQTRILSPKTKLRHEHHAFIDEEMETVLKTTGILTRQTSSKVSFHELVLFQKCYKYKFIKTILK